MTKSINKLPLLGIAVASVLALVGASSAALANGTDVTTFTASPTTLRSGDTLTYLVNGSSAPNASVDTFTGCYVYWINDQPFRNQIVGAISLPISGTTANYTAQNQTFRFAGWAGDTCVAPTPAGDPDWDTGTITITPQVVIDVNAVSVVEGEPVTAASFPYSEKSSTGTSPFNWATGGSFSQEAAGTCGLQQNTLPQGVSIDTATSSNGQAPLLKLTGTPAENSAGTYETCVKLQANTSGGGFNGSATAVMRVTVTEPNPAPAPDSHELAKTGSASTPWLMGMDFGLAALAIGAGIAVLQRRRRA